MKSKTIYKYFKKYGNKEQIDEALDKLDDNEKEIIKIIYGDDLDLIEVDKNKINQKTSNQFYNIIVPKIKKLLTNDNDIDETNKNNKEKNINKPKNLKTIYELLEEYGSKKEIDIVLSYLSEEEIELIKIKYGPDLNEKYIYNKNEYTSTIKNKMDHIIVPKIKSLLKQYQNGEEIIIDNTNGRIQTIYEYLEEYGSKEEIDTVLDKLDDKDKEIIKVKYGPNLNEKYEFDKNEFTSSIKNRFYNQLIPKIKKMLELQKDEYNFVIENNYIVKIQTIYEYLKEDGSKEEIDAVLDKLNDEDKEIIKAKYGPDLDKEYVYDQNIYNASVRKKFYGGVVPKIRKMLEKYKNGEKVIVGRKRPKTIYEYLKEYGSKEEIDAVLDKLNDVDKEIIKVKYGPNLDEVYEFDNNICDKSVKDRFYNCIAPKIKKMLKKYKNGEEIIVGKRRNRTIYEYLEKYGSKEEIDIVLDKLNDRDKEIIRIKYGPNLNEEYEYDKNLFNETIKNEFYKEIAPKIKRMLKKYKNGEEIIKDYDYPYTIHEYLDEYGSKEEIDIVLGYLNEEEIRILKIKYGPNFNEKYICNEEEFTKDIRHKISYQIIPKIKWMLKQYQNGEEITTNNFSFNINKTKTIYEYFEKYGSKEEIDIVLDKLNDKDKEIIRIKYGPDLNKKYMYDKNVCDELLNRKFYNVVAPKIRKMLKQYKNGEEILVYKNNKTIYERLEKYGSKEEINVVLGYLNDEEKEIIKIICGPNLNEEYEFDKSILDKATKNKFYEVIIPKIKRMLKRYQKGEKILVYKTGQGRNKTIYEYLKEYGSKEEIDIILDKLDNEDKEIIRIKYGPDLNKKYVCNEDVWNENLKSKFYHSIIPKIRKMLKQYKNGEEILVSKNNKPKTIYEYLEKYGSKEEIDIVLDYLCDEEKEIIKAKYGTDLNKTYVTDRNIYNKSMRNKFYNNVIPEIKRMLKQYQNGEELQKIESITGKVKTIYQCFKKYGSKEEIDVVLGYLNDEEKEIIKIKYGPDLNEKYICDKDVWNESLNKKFYGVISPKIKRMLKRYQNGEEILVYKTGFGKVKTIYEYLEKYGSKEEIDVVLDKLDDEEKEIIKIKYGPDLNKKYEYDENEFNNLLKDKFNNKIIPKIKRMLRQNDNEVLKKETENKNNNENKNIKEKPKQKEVKKVIESPKENEIKKSIKDSKPKELKKITDDNIPFEYLKMPNLKDMLTTGLTPKEVTIIILKFGLIDNKYYSNEAIANFFQIDVLEVIEITKKALLLYKEKVNNFVDNFIETNDSYKYKKKIT